MAKENQSQAPAPAAAAAAEAAPAGKIRLGMPIIYNAPKKKDKRRYSSGLKPAQKLERGVSRAVERIADGLERGASNYRSRSKKSAWKKRDGAIRDGFENWTRAAGKTLRVASKAPNDLIKRADADRLTKPVRQAVRAIVRPLFG